MMPLQIGQKIRSYSAAIILQIFYRRHGAGSSGISKTQVILQMLSWPGHRLIEVCGCIIFCGMVSAEPAVER